MKLLLLLSFLTTPLWAKDVWTPPENPDPHVILQEARDDARNDKYETALAKHLWYHENALTYRPSQSGVRLSFALSYWLDLAEDYPTAMEALLKVRAEAADEIVSGTAPHQLFADYVAFNRVLDKLDDTVKMFQRVHLKDPEFARRVFHYAKRALIAGKHYELIRHYLDPDVDIAREIYSYRSGVARYKDRERDADPQLLDYYNRHFTNEAATLVAILTLAKENETAQRIAKQAKEVRNEPTLHKAIDEALEGKVPEPFP